MTEFFRFLIAGVAVGSLYGVLAVGVTALLRGTSIPNFAQGSFGLLAAYVTWSLAAQQDVPVPLAVVAGLGAAGLLGYLADRFAMRRMLGAPVVSLLIFTLGLNLAINNGALLIWGPNTEAMPRLAPAGRIEIGSVAVSWQDVTFIVLGALIAWATAIFFKRTRVGLAMRATSENRIWPEYLGINVKSVLSLTWLVAGFLGGIAGILITSETYLDPNVMDGVIIQAFTAGAIGGFSSVLGAYAGGLILGVAENLAAGYISADFQQSVAFVFLLAVLVFRPQGLFGKEITRTA